MGPESKKKLLPLCSLTLLHKVLYIVYMKYSKITFGLLCATTQQQ